MTERLIQAIAKVIKKEYSAIDIYKDVAQQHFETPAFFIKQLLQPYSQIGLYGKKQTTHMMVIRYHPQSEMESECHAVGNKLCRLLELLPVDASLLRASNINFEIVDKVLCFYITYDVKFYTSLPEGDDMQILEIKEEVK